MRRLDRRFGSFEPFRGSVAFDVGGLYAVNTVGAALGAGLTGFALLPLLGIRGTTLVGVLLNAVAAGGVLLLAKRQPAHQGTRADLELPVPDADVARRLQPAHRRCRARDLGMRCAGVSGHDRQGNRARAAEVRARTLAR
jgi:hypothetical protein